MFGLIHKALVIIAKNPGITHRELALKLGTSQSYLSVLCKRFDPKLIRFEYHDKTKHYYTTPVGRDIGLLLDRILKMYEARY